MNFGATGRRTRTLRLYPPTVSAPDNLIFCGQKGNELIMKDYQEFESKMAKSVEHLAAEFGTIRAGRANSAVLDKIAVDYYGSKSPINQVASISSPEPHMLLIQPWDANLVREIEKAILTSDLGISPTNDGKIIRLAFPPLTEERRKELVKSINKKAEEAKVAVRAIRRDAVDAYKKMEKNSEITEDDLKIAEKDIQNLTDGYIVKIDDETKKKEKEIMAI